MRKLLSPFIGKYINEVFEIVVLIDGEEIVLCDTLFLVIEDKLIQVSIDNEFNKHIFEINSIEDIILYCEYEGLTSVRFEKRN